ncbi:MAG: HlyD family secretion protein [Rhodobiaceae bacterium]|nr:HlyD family secretion protein [Rhodobiaceae bacterium]MCC0056286.1 HlyD family secretion protein [Rhodobiaceae bacterium]
MTDARQEAQAPLDNPEAGKSPDSRRRRLRRRLLIAGPLLIVVIGTYVYFTGGRYVETDNAYLKTDKVMIAAEVSGLVEAVPVSENQFVHKGDVLFRIEQRPYEIALAAAEAGLRNVRDEVMSLKASFRQKDEELTLARANLDYAKKSYERQSKLAETQSVSLSRLDEVRHDLDVAKTKIDVAEQEMAQIRAQLGGDPDIPVEQHPRYLAAKATRDRAALDLERTTVRAPLNGIASNIPDIGTQVVGNGALSSPVMSLVGTDRVWIEANFKETDLTYLRRGQPVTIHVDTYPDREWTGEVESIAQATAAEFSVIPAQNGTGNWIKVVQRIPVRISMNASNDDKALRAGMSSNVEVDTGHRRALPGFVKTAIGWFSGDSKVAANSVGAEQR